MGRRGNRSRSRNRSGQPAQQGQQDQPAKGGSGKAQQTRSRQGQGRQGQGRGQGRQGQGKGQGRPARKIPFDPEKHYLPEPVPERDYEPCPISGKEIDDIASAIAHPQTGRPARFESVVESLSAQCEEEINEDQRIAYLGRGTFGLITFEKVPGKSQPMLVVKKYFEYEDNEKHTWRRELAPGISRDYVPHPQPLSDLYTSEEIAAFPRFDASGSGFSSRS